MPFLCPDCSSSTGSLNIKEKIELSADSRSDEIALQIVVCSRCSFSGIAVYEESRRGALDDDSFSHIGYRVSVEDQMQLRKMIQKCPLPKDRRCSCQVHHELGKKDSSGRWVGIREIQVNGEFELRF